MGSVDAGTPLFHRRLSRRVGCRTPKEPQPVDRHVGSRVRMRRMMVGMSQEKLGEACGITFQQVQKYEKGTNRMGASRLHQIARVLDVPIEFFYEGASSDQGSNGPIMIDGQSRSMTDFLATYQGREGSASHRRCREGRGCWRSRIKG